MLFWMFGSSCSGKTYTLERLHARDAGLVVHDFDELGAVDHRTLAWRRRTNERWLRRALELDGQGLDLLVAGQSPLGELLVAPSAPDVSIRACLLDCDDVTRTDRLEARGGEWLSSTGATLHDFVEWGRWMRGHAADPMHRIDVIRNDESLRWERMDGLAGDPRWPIPIVDSVQPVERVVAEIEAWIARERTAARRAPMSLGDSSA